MTKNASARVRSRGERGVNRCYVCYDVADVAEESLIVLLHGDTNVRA